MTNCLKQPTVGQSSTKHTFKETLIKCFVLNWFGGHFAEGAAESIVSLIVVSKWNGETDHMINGEAIPFFAYT